MKWFALALPVFFVVTLANAASFDCVKARTKIETMICGDAELSKLDADLGQAYRKALQREDVKQGAIESQRNWLRLERDMCADVPCLKQAYQKRIKELGLTSSFGIVLMRVPPGTQPSNAIPSATASAPAATKQVVAVAPSHPHPKQTTHPTVCYAVADAANRGKLSELAFKLPEDGLVDINGDGKKERVTIQDSGTMHWEEVEVTAADGGPLDVKEGSGDDWESDNLRWALDKMLIKHEGRIYILGMTEEYLHYLSSIGKDNVERVVCEFSQSEKPVETITTSANNKLCRSALERKLDYVPFDRTHKLTQEAIEDNGPYTPMPSDSAALVDIDNNGKPKLVVNMEVASGAGRGCDGEYLAVLNKAGNGLDFPTSRPEVKFECGGVTQVPFTYEGQTYIEIRYADKHPVNVHKVVQLKDGELNTVCQYDVRLVQYVLGNYERIIANAKAAYKDPWVYALEQPGTDALKILLDAGQDLHIVRGQNSFGSPLHDAIRQGKHDALRFLLEHGADPNIRPEPPLDQSPLIVAVQMNSTEDVKLLLQHGADPSLSWLGKTAAQWINTSINSEADRETMRKLLASGAKR